MTNDTVGQAVKEVESEGPPQCFVAENLLITEEQKKWRRLRVTASGPAVLVPVDAPDPVVRPSDAALLTAVADMLNAGFAGSAEALFRYLRESGRSLRAVVGEDGALRVTVVGG